MAAKTAVYIMEGTGEVLEVFENKLTITPKGALGLLSKGLKIKTILFTSIGGIQFKKSGWTGGYLHFSMLGETESKDGEFNSATDENTFMYSGDDEMAEEIKDYIEDIIAKAHSAPAPSYNPATIPAFVLAPAPAPTVLTPADEITKYFELKQKGIISEEEFAAKKKKLFGDAAVELCPSCGARVSDKSKCEFCGAQLTPEKPKKPEEAKAKEEAPKPNVPKAEVLEAELSEKSGLATFLISIFLGFFGADRFYAGRTVLGVIKLLTFGGFGIWWVVDLFLIASGKFTDTSGRNIGKSSALKICIASFLTFLYICIIASMDEQSKAETESAKPSEYSTER